jgi:hypothetical protein
MKINIRNSVIKETSRYPKFEPLSGSTPSPDTGNHPKLPIADLKLIRPTSLISPNQTWVIIFLVPGEVKKREIQMDNRVKLKTSVAFRYFF